MTPDQEAAGRRPCPSLVDLLVAADAAAEAAAALHVHAERCPACRQTLADARLLAQLREDIAADWAAGAAARKARVVRALRTAPFPAPRRERPSRRAVVALVVAVLMVGVGQHATGAETFLDRAVARQRARRDDAVTRPARLVIRLLPLADRVGPGCAPWMGIVEAPTALPPDIRQRLGDRLAAAPLDATALRRWWAQAPRVRRHDVIVVQGDVLGLRTTLIGAPVRQVEVRLRQRTYDVVGLTLRDGVCRVDVEPLVAARVPEAAGL